MKAPLYFTVPKQISKFNAKSAGVSSITVTGWTLGEMSECFVTYDVCISRKEEDCLPLERYLSSKDIRCALNKTQSV